MESKKEIQDESTLKTWRNWLIYKSNKTELELDVPLKRFLVFTGYYLIFVGLLMSTILDHTDFFNENDGKWEMKESKLSNLAGVTLDVSWQLTDAPLDGSFASLEYEIVNIKNDVTNLYLSVNGNSIAGYTLANAKADVKNSSQQWIKKNVNGLCGYFTLINNKSESFLTRHNSQDKPTVEGTVSFLSVVIFT